MAGSYDWSTPGPIIARLIIHACSRAEDTMGRGKEKEKEGGEGEEL